MSDDRQNTPSGYVLVPLEPMPEAVAAWWKVKNGYHLNGEPEPTDTSDYAAYRALVRAAAVSVSQTEAVIAAEQKAMIDRNVSGDTPMDRWERHTGIRTFAHLREWAERLLRETLTMRAHRAAKNGGLPPNGDDMEDYLIGKQAVLCPLLANMRQISEAEADHT